MTGDAQDPTSSASADEEALVWLLDRVRIHDDKISTHDEQIVALQGTKPDASETDDGSETDEEALQKYVDHLVEDFSMSAEIRTTWRDNAAVVQELDALRRLRDYAFSKEAGAFDRVHYHDAVERVRERLVRHHGRHKKREALGGPPRG